MGVGAQGIGGVGVQGSAAPSSQSQITCCGPNSDILWNLCLLLAVCAFEAVLAMVCGSFTLMLDFYRRLGNVFAMVYTLEAVQARGDVSSFNGQYVPRAALPEIHASSNPAEQQAKVDAASAALRGSDSRRRVLAALLISAFLVTVAFVRAMGAIVSMYGGAPDAVKQPGWVIVAGCLCLVLDLVHVFFGVEIVLHDVFNDQHSSKWVEILLTSYGAILVIFEGIIDASTHGGYASPIISLVLCAIIGYVESEMLTKTSAMMQSQAWLRRV
jgi:succinate dehydrogenase hydrophobic anchor subunit